MKDRFFDETVDEFSSVFWNDVFNMASEHLGLIGIKYFFSRFVPVNNDSLAVGSDNREAGAVDQKARILVLNIIQCLIGMFVLVCQIFVIP